jgi:hypothetical protein
MNAPHFASRHMPRLRWFDPSEQLLVLDYLDGAQTLGSAHSLESILAIACAEELGEALALLHDSTLDGSPDLEIPLPWILGVCHPGAELLAQLSSTAILVLKIVQQIPDFAPLLDGLARYSAPSTPIHGDVRWDNCLARTNTDSDSPHLSIVDWELAGLGDPCWDVGGVISEYLSCWIRSVPVMRSLSLSESLGLAGCSLGTIQQGVATFWSSYSKKRRTACNEAFLVRSVQWSAARLAQSAIESAQASAQLTGSLVYMLQLAENITWNPRSAALNLLLLLLV